MARLWICFRDICSGLFYKLWARYHVSRKPPSEPVPEEMAAKIFTGMPFKPLPVQISEEMVIEIFSKMPVESVHSCKQVYGDWNTLLSTTYFNHDIFLPRASPTIIVHRGSVDGHKLFYIDDDCRGGLTRTDILLWELGMPLDNPSPNWLPISNFHPVRFSCYGLLFLPWLYRDICSAVINPVTRKYITIDHNFNVKGDVCGAFLHPIEREYRVLWVSSWITRNKYSCVKFKLLGPRSESRPKSCWRALIEFKYRPLINEPPVILHECLHWICIKYNSAHWSHSVMVFSTVKEEFKVMPSINIAHQMQDRQIHIFDLDGHLSLWQLTDVINIWTVENYYASWSWTKRYSVDVKLVHKKVNIDEVRVVGVQNGALVIHWIGKGIFVYHLRHNTTKKYLFDKLKGGSPFTYVFLHTKSLISMPGLT